MTKEDYLMRLEKLMSLVIYQDIPRVDETITLQTLQTATTAFLNNTTASQP